MALLLVDDSDGRIVAEVENEEQARQILEDWTRSDGTLPDCFCLVEMRDHQGALLGTETTVKVRPLS